MSDWIPIKKRPMSDEEDKELLEYESAISRDEALMFDCQMPEDGQEMLVSTEYGVYYDICYIDTIAGFNSFALEYRGDWDNVTAWMPLPEPYKEGA